MAEAREPLGGTRPDGVGRCGVGIRRLPGSFYGEHAEQRRHGRHGNGRYRRSRPVSPGLTAMMVAMMVPATLPLILLYRTIARNRLSLLRARAGVVIVLLGYIAVWALAGLPVYAYNSLAGAAESLATLWSALLLIIGGAYQFTSLKRICHTRCSSPLFFVMHNWRSGASGALRVGMLHGVECLGCCAGLMVGLVALGMMNLAWMLTASLIIFAEKTLPNSHRISRPLGVVMVGGGVVLLATSLLGGMVSGME